MDARIATKPRRHKKRKSRTQVSSDSDSSDSDAGHQEKKPTRTNDVNATLKKEKRESAKVQDAVSSVKPAITAETAVSTEFTKYLMQRATLEFADDLNAIRSADDFKGAESVSILVHALQQGTSTFSTEDQARVVSAGKTEREMDG